MRWIKFIIYFLSLFNKIQIFKRNIIDDTQKVSWSIISAPLLASENLEGGRMAHARKRATTASSFTRLQSSWAILTKARRTFKIKLDVLKKFPIWIYKTIQTLIFLPTMAEKRNTDKLSFYQMHHDAGAKACIGMQGAGW
jgi:hypothetical protein